MAKLTIDSYIDIGTEGYHNASSWQVALDPDFTQIIDESLKDTVNVKEWHTMLPKIGGKGYYADLDNLYARVKVHVGKYESHWFPLPTQSQNVQQVIITEDGKDNIVTTSNAIHMQ